jgi:hypothetical protein
MGFQRFCAGPSTKASGSIENTVPNQRTVVMGAGGAMQWAQIQHGYIVKNNGIAPTNK